MNSSTLAMRRRSVWEAADSGIILWKKHFSYIIRFYAVPVLCAATVFYFSIPQDFWWISVFFLWWLKPFFDRFCLQVISVRFFDDDSEENSGNRRILKGMAGTIFHGLPGDLVWRRFSPSRCSGMPLRIMERLKQVQYETRKKTLAADGLNFSVFLSCLGLLLEILLLGGEILFCLILCEFIGPDVNNLFELHPRIIFTFIYILYCFNYVLVESLYVCMGFGIYINSRVETEGWDLEILFRKFTSRISGIVKVFIIVFGIFSVSAVFADDTSPDNKNYFPPDFISVESVPMAGLEEILSSEDFGGTESSWTIVFKNQNDEVLPDRTQVEIPWQENIREILGNTLRVFLIMLLAGLFVFLLIRLYKSGFFLRQSRDSVKKPIPVPNQIPGNPELYFMNAEKFFQRGMILEAWAACYNGVLSSFINMNIVFPPEITEYGCLNIINSKFQFKKSDTSDYLIDNFGNLIEIWTRLVYGGFIPPEGSFQKAIEFGRKAIALANAGTENIIA